MRYVLLLYGYLLLTFLLTVKYQNEVDRHVFPATCNKFCRNYVNVSFSENLIDQHGKRHKILKLDSDMVFNNSDNNCYVNMCNKKDTYYNHKYRVIDCAFEFPEKEIQNNDYFSFSQTFIRFLISFVNISIGLLVIFLMSLFSASIYLLIAIAFIAIAWTIAVYAGIFYGVVLVCMIFYYVAELLYNCSSFTKDAVFTLFLNFSNFYYH